VAVVAINRRPVHSPWGGGNQWLDQIVRFLRYHGYSVRFTLDETVDCVLLIDPRPGPTASFDIPAIERLKAARPQLAVIHRVNDNDQHRGSDFRDALQARAAGVTDHTVFLSQWLCDYEAERWFDRRRPHSVILNGADPRHFHPMGASPWTRATPLRLATHHWSKEWNKGFRVYAEIDRMIADGALPGVELRVAGRWPDEIAWRTAQTSPPLGQPELGAWLRQCHVYVTASQWESGGMHFIEGAQCGLPVLFHVNGGGVVELATRFGIAFDNDLRAAITAVQARYGELRRAVLDDPPSGDRMCLAYRALIQRTIQEKRDSA
jgi:glycosyltransferase involved in cell wall biosynthesis